MKTAIIAVITALAIAAPFNGLARMVSAQDAPHLTRNFTEPFDSVIIDNAGGSIEAQTWPSSAIRVIAAIEGRGNALKPESAVSFDKPYNGALRIVAQQGASLSLTVYVPSHVKLSIKGGTHAVTVKGAMSGVSAETSSGDIALHLPAETNSDISARAFEGTISSKLPVTIFGPLDAHTIDGKIGMGGTPVILRSLQGRISLLHDNPSRLSEIASLAPDSADAMETGSAPVMKDRASTASSNSLNTASNAFSRKRSKADRSEDPPLRPPKEADVVAIKLETQLVNLNVKVSDLSGKSVPNLTKEDFVVFEDGEPQEITHFEPITAPVNLVLVLDLSGSTKKKMDAMKKAAKKFIESLNPRDRVAIAAFTRRFMVISNFTTDRKLLKDRIDDMKNRSGGTAYYDAMWATLDLFNEINETRKAIVVLTDGVDNSISDPDDYEPRHPFDDLLSRIAQEETTIYPIYFDTEYETVVKNGSGSHQEYVTAREQLQEVADQTGAMLFKANRVEDLEGAYQRVASELHALYSIAYSAKNTKSDGRWRSINVKVNRDNTNARTRRGYYAR